MCKAKRGRRKAEAAVGKETLLLWEAHAVLQISEYRQISGGKLQAYLVAPPGQKFGLHLRDLLPSDKPAAKHTVVKPCFLGARRSLRYDAAYIFLLILQNPVRKASALFRRLTEYQRAVALLRLLCLQLFRERCRCRRGLPEEHEPCDRLIESAYQSHIGHALSRPRKMLSHQIHHIGRQAARLFALHAGGLYRDQHFGILIDDFHLLLP